MNFAESANGVSEASTGRSITASKCCSVLKSGPLHGNSVQMWTNTTSTNQAKSPEVLGVQ